ncbi:MAG: C-terminal binding protein [Acidobacteriota bacterium]
MNLDVYVLDSALVPHTQEVQVEQQVLEGCATVHLLRLSSDVDFLPHRDKASAIILWHQLALTRQLIEQLSKTRLIVRNGVGFENVDIVAAAERGIAVCNVPDYGTEEVADHAITLALCLNRQMPALAKDIQQGNWRWQTALKARRLRGKSFGIVGCGRIGTATALRAKALGLNVSFFDPYLPQGYQKAIGVARFTRLADLLHSADFVSLHTPLTEETRYLIDSEQLRSMKSEAYLINTSRGPVVRQTALEEALEKGWIAGAALDVLEHEPAGLDSLLRFGNCILTPHSAFYSQESLVEMRRTAAQTVRDALTGNGFANVVNGVTESTDAGGARRNARR